MVHSICRSYYCFTHGSHLDADQLFLVAAVFEAAVFDATAFG